MTDTPNTFTDLGLHKHVLKAIVDMGYETPTPIQQQAIPHLLERRDLLGIAQTGTGKTAAFALPTLDYLVRNTAARKPKSCRVLVLSPTRELAGQIAETFSKYGKYSETTIQTVFGGVKIQRQIRNMSRGCHILVATPGRLADLMQQGAVNLQGVETLILDEADVMFDMGFMPQLKKIVDQIPVRRQTLLFSATMPPAIEKLTQVYLQDPVKVVIAQEGTTAERVTQNVMHVSNNNKLQVLQALLEQSNIERGLIFTRTKSAADKVVRRLMTAQIKAEVIHGNKSQPQRRMALENFKAGKCRVLVATDIAARGIDVSGVSHVINFEMPNVAEQYVHRIGRTGRAGKEGAAVSLVAEDELYYLREVERTIRQDIEVYPTPEGCESLVLPAPDPNKRAIKPKGPSRGGNRGGQGGGGGRNRSASSPDGQRSGGKPGGRPGGGRPGGRPGGGGGGGKPGGWNPTGGKPSAGGGAKHRRPQNRPSA